MKTATFKLPDFWASALINGDESGLSEVDGQALANWQDTIPGLGPCLDCGEEGEFAWHHDASELVLACSVVEYTFEIIA